jgi:hypothetical protein
MVSHSTLSARTSHQTPVHHDTRDATESASRAEKLRAGGSILRRVEPVGEGCALRDISAHLKGRWFRNRWQQKLTLDKSTVLVPI